jgi:hypothetical protein
MEIESAKKAAERVLPFVQTRKAETPVRPAPCIEWRAIQDKTANAYLIVFSV